MKLTVDVKEHIRICSEKQDEINDLHHQVLALRALLKEHTEDQLKYFNDGAIVGERRVIQKVKDTMAVWSSNLDLLESDLINSRKKGAE